MKLQWSKSHKQNYNPSWREKTIFNASSHSVTIVEPEKEKIPISFDCPYGECDFVANTSELLISHVNTHHEYICEKCDEEFDGKRDLTEHMQNNHAQEDESGRNWNCDDCAFQGGSSHSLVEHLRISKHQASITSRTKVKCYTCQDEQMTSYFK